MMEGETRRKLDDMPSAFFSHRSRIGRTKRSPGMKRNTPQTGGRRPNRPSQRYLLGPTGVGKRCWSALSHDSQLDDERASSASTCRNTWRRHEVSRMIGATPGYVGYRRGAPQRTCSPASQLGVCSCESKRPPRCLKCMLHPSKTGRLYRRAGGAQVRLQNTVIVMTSNVGSGHAQAGGRHRFSSATTAAS